MSGLVARTWKTLKGISAFLRLNIAHMLLFLAVNVVFGALGVWMPVLVGWARSGSWWASLLAQFENSGPYTFAIAFLAACISYVVAEYLDKQTAKWKQLKVLLATVAAVLIIVCTGLSSSQTSFPAHEGSSLGATSSAKYIDQQSRQNTDPQTATAIAPSRPVLATPAELPPPHYLQALLTIVSIITGFLIFLTFLALSEPMKAALTEIEGELEDETDALIDELSSKQGASRGASE